MKFDKIFDYHLECRIDIAFKWDIPKLFIQYTDEIIDKKGVLSSEDFRDGTYWEPLPINCPRSSYTAPKLIKYYRTEYEWIHMQQENSRVSTVERSWRRLEININLTGMSLKNAARTLIMFDNWPIVKKRLKVLIDIRTFFAKTKKKVIHQIQSHFNERFQSFPNPLSIYSAIFYLPPKIPPSRFFEI